MIHYIPVPQNSSNDTKAQILGVIIGTLLGALVGALATYIIGEQARKKQKEIDEIKEQRLKLRAHETAIKKANAEIEGLLVLILKNIQHYHDIEQGILDSEGNFRTTISMPQPYPHEAGLGVDMLSVSLATKWQSFESEVVLQNSNLNEFNDYYVNLRTSAHELLLKSEDLNRQVIDSDNTAIKSGEAQCIEAAESFLERCFVLLAEMELGAMRWKSFDFTAITLTDLKEYIEKVHSFKPTDKQLTKRINSEYRSVYTSENAFKLARKQAEATDSSPIGPQGVKPA